MLASRSRASMPRAALIASSPFPLSPTPALRAGQLGFELLHPQTEEHRSPHQEKERQHDPPLVLQRMRQYGGSFVNPQRVQHKRHSRRQHQRQAPTSASAARHARTGIHVCHLEQRSEIRRGRSRPAQPGNQDHHPNNHRPHREPVTIVIRRHNASSPSKRSSTA